MGSLTLCRTFENACGIRVTVISSSSANIRLLVVSLMQCVVYSLRVCVESKFMLFIIAKRVHDYSSICVCCRYDWPSYVTPWSFGQNHPCRPSISKWETGYIADHNEGKIITSLLLIVLLLDNLCFIYCWPLPRQHHCYWSQYSS
jgi:hypothetical protein